MQWDGSWLDCWMDPICVGEWWLLFAKWKGCSCFSTLYRLLSEPLLQRRAHFPNNVGHAIGPRWRAVTFTLEDWSQFKTEVNVEAQWPIGYGVGLRIKRSSVRIRPWPLRWVLGIGSLLPLSQGEAFTLASISYLVILVKYILAKKKKIQKFQRIAEW